MKTTAKVYREDLSGKTMKPLSQTMFNGGNWIFQQDYAPAHKAKTMQEWLASNAPEFIKASDWPSGSPDLNPLDYKLWAELELMACHRRHPNIESLKRALVKSAASISMDMVHTAINE